MAGHGQLNSWDRNAPLPDTPQAVIGWDEAKNTVLSAFGGFSPEMADIARVFFDKRWIDAPASGLARPRALSLIRRCLRPIPMCC
jgi:oligoendopeptidase F